MQVDLKVFVFLTIIAWIALSALPRIARLRRGMATRKQKSRSQSQARFHPIRSSAYGERLTDLELKHIRSTDGHCPDCETGVLMEGPHGGLSVNYRCSTCGSKFNLAPGPFGERISDVSPALKTAGGN